LCREWKRALPVPRGMRQMVGSGELEEEGVAPLSRSTMPPSPERRMTVWC